MTTKIKLITLLIVVSLYTALVWYVADTKWQSKWEAQQLQIAVANQKHTEAVRKQEQTWQGKVDKVEQNAQDKINQANNDADVARKSTERLRLEFSTYLRKHTKNSGVATTSTTTSSSEDLSADVFARINERARELAEYADKARVAGNACEQYADNLQQ